jgi:rare lipoprotein A
MRNLVMILFVLIIGCTSNARYTTKGGTGKKHGKSTYGKVEKKGKTMYYVCSYYADKFHGRQTANGEIFDMYKMTAAHKTLPFNTKLRVTFEETGKSVVVRINDRGPFVYGRDLDLSYGAAKEIGLIPYGVKKLKVEILEDGE